MALTEEMLEQFRQLVSETDQPLLQINLTTDKSIYGYLREVGESYFTVDELQTSQTMKSTGRWMEMQIIRETRKVGRITLSLDLVSSWRELPPNAKVPVA